MTNNINSPNTNNTNILAAKKLEATNTPKRAPIYIPAPQTLPKYSITQKMEEADTFKKTVLNTNYKKRERKKTLKRLLTIAAMTVAGFIGYKYCKKS